MKVVKIIMGMPVTVEVADDWVKVKDIKKVFDYFVYIDKKFSTYKKSSEITKINKGFLDLKYASLDMKKVFKLSAKTKIQTDGFFNIRRNGKFDPSGLVKGWAIFNACKILRKSGFKNFYIEAGGDVQVFGKNKKGNYWSVGIKNPFHQKQIIKVLTIKNKGVATSGTYIRGSHIYNPKGEPDNKIVSLTVIGPNIYEADRFATAAFAMGSRGIKFIEALNGFEGYIIDTQGMATMTSNFEKYT